MYKQSSKDYVIVCWMLILVDFKVPMIHMYHLYANRTYIDYYKHNVYIVADIKSGLGSKLSLDLYLIYLVFVRKLGRLIEK